MIVIKASYSSLIWDLIPIKSLNIPADSPIAFITFEDDGKTVINPYKLLPPIAEYMGMTEEEAREYIWEKLSRDIVKRTINGFGNAGGISARKVQQ